MLSKDAYDMVRAKMEEASAAHRDELNRQMFASGNYVHVAPAPLTPWRQMLVVRGRVTAYLSTLWRALKGEDPYESLGEDY